MNNKYNDKNIIKLIEILNIQYPDAKCSLYFSSPFELGIAVMLSAQCTDDRVNQVTPNLFAKCNTPESVSNIDITELENLIHSCGFYKVKAKNIKLYAKQILEKYNGELPKNISELITIPGIGRKSANVIMLEAFNEPVGIAVDTHVKRISNRLGLSYNKEPSKIEKDLLTIIPAKYYKDVNHLFIWHGRNICTARNPKCSLCPVSNFCQYYQSNIDKTNAQAI